MGSGNGVTSVLRQAALVSLVTWVLVGLVTVVGATLMDVPLRRAAAVTCIWAAVVFCLGAGPLMARLQHGRGGAVGHPGPGLRARVRTESAAPHLTYLGAVFIVVPQLGAVGLGLLE